MTLIMFDQFEDAAVLVTDTLTSWGLEEPAGLSHKVWALPHLNMAFTITGAAVLGQLLYHHLNDSMIVDIDAANATIPEALREFKELLEKDHGDLGYSRVLTFGFPSDSESIVSYQYGADRNFEPDEHFQGSRFGLIPNGGYAFEITRPDNVEQYISLATRVREANDQRLAFNPCAIGGELFLTMIKNWNIQIVRLHRFEDYEQTREAITHASPS